MRKFDLLVIGSGPAGFAAAMKGIDYKKNVCIVEAADIGGAGIMNGVLTSKTMWELSRDFFVASSVDRGYRASGLTVDYKKVRNTVLKAAKNKQYQLLSQIETFSRESEDDGQLTLIRGRAKFIDNHTVEITKEDGVEQVQATNFIIATGSRPRPIPGIEIDQKQIIDSNGILNLKEFPERMIIIGSGIVGCEFATIFSNFKQTEVHLLDRSHRVLPYEDKDVGEFVSKSLEDNGVIIHNTATLRTIHKKDKYLEIVLDYKDGHSKVIEVDIALVSIGRISNTDNLGLENIDIDTTNNGDLKINEICMLSDKPHIFAAGDITGHAKLYNVAELQGRYAVRGIYENTIFAPDYSSMSTLMFFKPLIAAVGMNETQLRKEKIAYRAAYYSNELVNRTIAMQSTNGFVKLMISDDGSEKILGMRAAGPQASASIVSVAHLINQGKSIADGMKIIHPHPSVTEGIQECLRVLNSESVFKPKAFPNEIKVWAWKPEKL